MIQCKDCKHFERGKHDYHSEIELATGYAGVCGLTVTKGYHGGHVEMNSLTRAYAADPYEYGALLVVQENFGCIQGERKESSA